MSYWKKKKEKQIFPKADESTAKTDKLMLY